MRESDLVPPACCMLPHRLSCADHSQQSRPFRFAAVQDKDYREAYGVCEADASKCGAIKPDSAKPPCVLKCMSPKCYQEVYGQDALEEGELDYTRRREYKTCFRKEVNERRALEKEAERQKQRET